MRHVEYDASAVKPKFIHTHVQLNISILTSTWSICNNADIQHLIKVLPCVENTN